nr:hypothetical protein [Tanacetum cinerariifolium]
MIVNKAVQIRDLIYGKKIIVNETSIRRDLKLQDAEGTAFLPNDTIFEELARIGKETEVPYIEPQTKKSVPTPSNNLLPSGEDRMQLTELMNLCTNLQKQVLDLKEAKTAQAKEISNLMKRVKKLERKKKSRTLAEIDDDEDLSLINKTAQDQGRMNEEDLFGVNDLDGDEVIVDVTTTLIEEWDDVQAIINADRKLVEQIQAQEREHLSIEERSKLLAELIESRRKENGEKDKNNTSKITEGSSKRAGDKIEPESAKRQRLEKEDDTAELKRCLEIVLEDDDDVTFEATPISSKSPTINFNREDFKVLRSIVKTRLKKTKPVNDMDNLLFQTLKTMFEHQNMVYYLLVEKMYPFERNILHQLWNDVRLQCLDTSPDEDKAFDQRNLKIQKANIKFRGGLMGFKGLHGVTTIQLVPLVYKEEGDDFGVDVLRFHTCIIDILGFIEKLEWWFEQDIADEEEEDEEGEGGSE